MQKCKFAFLHFFAYRPTHVCCVFFTFFAFFAFAYFFCIFAFFILHFAQICRNAVRRNAVLHACKVYAVFDMRTRRNPVMPYCATHIKREITVYTNHGIVENTTIYVVCKNLVEKGSPRRMARAHGARRVAAPPAAPAQATRRARRRLTAPAGFRVGACVVTGASCL